MNIVLGIVGAAVANWQVGFLGISLTGWIGYLEQISLGSKREGSQYLIKERGCRH